MINTKFSRKEIINHKLIRYYLMRQFIGKSTYVSHDVLMCQRFIYKDTNRNTINLV